MRTRWISPLVTLLAAGGLAWAQPSPDARPGPPAAPALPASPEPGQADPLPSDGASVPYHPAAVPETGPALPGTPGQGQGCDQPGCTEGEDYPTHDRLWIDAEYLLWWVKPTKVP